MTPVLEIDDLWLDIRGAPVLRGFELAIRPGEVFGLVGESGAGKTMVGRAVLGVAPPGAAITRGAIRFEGMDLGPLDGPRRRRLLGHALSLIPQDPMTALNPVRRIEAQLTDVLRLHRGSDRAAARARALELLAQVHIRAPDRVLQLYPHELSGGMRQRVLIAAAFACRPKLIVADEPTTALDVTVQRQILRLIKELQDSAGTAILFVTHDLGVVAKICDRVAVMHAGRILEAASATELFAAPRHPYTRGLMAATPRYDRPGEALTPVPAELVARLTTEAEALDA